MSIFLAVDFYSLPETLLSSLQTHTHTNIDLSVTLTQTLPKIKNFNFPLEPIFQYTSLKERTLKPDILFPDLYFLPFKSDCDVYQDYLKKKLFRTGLEEDEIGDLFNYKTRARGVKKETPLDYSNKMFHKGRSIDMTKLSTEEHLKVLNEFGYEQLRQYNNLECIRSLHHISTPTRKLHYPEPFIASPSFIHTDIGFIHVLHYQY